MFLKERERKKHTLKSFGLIALDAAAVQGTIMDPNLEAS
jgi:hypothetical protein